MNIRLDRVLKKFDDFEGKIDRFRLDVDDHFAQNDERQNRLATELGMTREHVKRQSTRMAKYSEDLQKLEEKVHSTRSTLEQTTEIVREQSGHDLEHEAKLAKEIVERSRKISETEANVAETKGLVENLALSYQHLEDKVEAAAEKQVKLEEGIAAANDEILLVKKQNVTQLNQLATIGQMLTSMVKAGKKLTSNPTFKLLVQVSVPILSALGAILGSCEVNRQSRAAQEQRYQAPTYYVPGSPPGLAPPYQVAPPPSPSVLNSGR